MGLLSTNKIIGKKPDKQSSSRKKRIVYAELTIKG